MRQRLEAEGLRPIYESMEMPLVVVLAEMEKAGVKVDTKLLGGMSRDMDTQLQSLTIEIHRLAKGEFNINSPKRRLKGRRHFKTKLRLDAARYLPAFERQKAEVLFPQRFPLEFLGSQAHRTEVDRLDVWSSRSTRSSAALTFGLEQSASNSRAPVSLTNSSGCCAGATN